ncbi:dipeptide ABC transporter ATP-binding protein [Sporolactobacillus sp. Y61]|uniref:Dipeptide ABC transporter ATP-binding protein n=1 Tax=Sporolactobacillus sp. Y61 TaxID=3160863 RepID=A0AAU8IIS0_9BACL
MSINADAVSSEKLLEVKDLKKFFYIKKGLAGFRYQTVKAVDDVNFYVNKGETLGIVGESGCGKSTMGRSILQLQKPTDGSVKFEGIELTKLKNHQIRKLRKDMQMVFQDPFGSLNPRMTIGSMLKEIVNTHHIVNEKDSRTYVENLLEQVGLKKTYYNRYAHEFSGGQRQRISIARALAVKPKMIVCDEAVSALDVSVQAQILNLLQKLKKEYQLTYIFISHDLSVVKHISDRVAVMYLGQIVELANKTEIFDHPLHPYLKALLSAIPQVNQTNRERIILKGEVPSPINIPEGCRFHTRCPFAKDICRKKVPSLEQKEYGHWVACHFV